MKKLFHNIIQGYQVFREKYVLGDQDIMKKLAHHGQNPQILVVACCDSRVDPALLLQCDPGDLFVVRNVANIVPPYENDEAHHGTSAALEFGVCYLNVKHLIILGHSQCGGINALLHKHTLHQNDFISRWVALINDAGTDSATQDTDNYAKLALLHSYHNCLTFPWIKQRIEQDQLRIHLWYFDIHSGEISFYSHTRKKYMRLSDTDTEAFN